jgi:prepilin-type N-terminal cleavage/methylation domain-containing protein
MRTSSVGAISKERGVTLLELLIVMTLIALMVGVSYPSAMAGIEALRLRSVSDTLVSFLNTAVDRAARRHQVIEIWISPRENVLIARSPDLAFSRRLDIPESFRITSVLPQAQGNPNEPRRFLLYPGGTVPRIGIEISNNAGRKRWVGMDPFTGLPGPVSESPAAGQGAARELH